MDVAERAGVPVSGTVRLTHDPADAIVNTVEQYDSDGVLMGWGGRRSRRRDIAVGSTVDDVATEADADVFVENVGEGESDGDVDSILLPWTGGNHADLAAETAAAIARTTGATIDVVHVVGSGDDRSEAEAVLTGAEERLAEQASEFEDVDLEFRTRIVEGEDVEEALVEEADGHDVVVIAAEKEGILQRLVFGSIPESVGDRIDETSIMCKRNVGAPSRLKRLLT
jgi:nucleotide-binding universal stress UspA family protein